MTFARGVTLPIATTLGHADTSSLGPTAGNGFFQRWPDDLAMLVASDVDAVRITFDWARLQPRPGEFSGDWVEWYDNVIAASDALGIAVWATMYDAGVPKWFDNEGGLDDDSATIRWWPRFVERVAERFGDTVHGWIPFAVLPSDLPLEAWTDTWGILGAGPPPVATSFAFADGVGHIARRLEQLDIVGLALDTTIDIDINPTDDEVRIAGDRWADAIYEAVDAAASKPLLITEFTPDHHDPEVSALLVARLVEVVDAAVADGVDIATCFVDPAIAGPDSDLGLFDSDRAPLPAASAYFTAAPAPDA